MTLWDVGLVEAPPAAVQTWDVGLRTESWTYYDIVGTAVAVDTTGYSLLPSDNLGYTLRASSTLGYSLSGGSDQIGYSLKSGNEQEGYTLLT